MGEDPTTPDLPQSEKGQGPGEEVRRQFSIVSAWLAFREQTPGP